MGVVEDAMRVVEFVNIGVNVTAVCLVYLVELTICPTSAGRVVGVVTHAVAI